MSRPASPRDGEPLRVRELLVRYSFWPTRKTTRWKLQRRLYVKDPWAILNEAVYRSGPKGSTKQSREEALSYLEQAEEYFNAGAPAGRSVKPLLLYYSMMNLAKCVIRMRLPNVDMSRARHGLAAAPTGKRAILGDRISVKTSRVYTNVFQELLRVLSPKSGSRFKILRLRDLLPQILTGHRLWTYASAKLEKFLAVTDIQCHVDSKLHQAWLHLTLNRGEFRYTLKSIEQLLKRSHLPGKWHQVGVPSQEQEKEKELIALEQREATKYQQRPIDCLNELFQRLRPALWYAVTSTSPHRQYYLFIDSQQEVKRLPQWAAIYVLFFYLSDLTRYRPEHFDRIVASKHGPQIEAVLDDCPRQFLYMIASELLEREVAPAAIV